MLQIDTRRATQNQSTQIADKDNSVSLSQKPIQKGVRIDRKMTLETQMLKGSRTKKQQRLQTYKEKSLEQKQSFFGKNYDNDDERREPQVTLTEMLGTPKAQNYLNNGDFHLQSFPKIQNSIINSVKRRSSVKQIQSQRNSVVGLQISGKQSSGLKDEPPSTKASMLKGAYSSMILPHKQSEIMDHSGQEQNTPANVMQMSPNPPNFHSEADFLSSKFQNESHYKQSRFLRRVGGSLPGMPINGASFSNMDRRASLSPNHHHTSQLTPNEASILNQMQLDIPRGKLESAMAFQIPLDASTRFLKRQGIGSNQVFKSIEHEVNKSQQAKFNQHQAIRRIMEANRHGPFGQSDKKLVPQQRLSNLLSSMRGQEHNLDERGMANHVIQSPTEQDLSPEHQTPQPLIKIFAHESEIQFTPTPKLPRIKLPTDMSAQRMSARSQSLVIPSVDDSNIFSSKSENRISLQEKTLAQSQSRVLQLLRRPIIHKQEETKPMITPRKKKQPEFVPLIDPKKIVLEIDLVDKEKLFEEAERKKKDELFRRTMTDETQTFSVEDQIEIIRRQLILNELGIDIPIHQNGDLDIKKLMAIEIKFEKDHDPQEMRELANKQGRIAKQDKYGHVESMFPIMQKGNNQINNLDLVDRRVFSKQLEQISNKPNPLTDFAEQQKTTEHLILKQGIFRDRLAKLNKHLDDTFKQASELLLDDKRVLEMYQQQIRDEIVVTGKPLYSMQPTIFETRWKLMPNMKTHGGTLITHSGMLMDEAYLKREAHLEQLKEKFGLKAPQRKLDSVISLNEDGDHQNVSEVKYSTTMKGVSVIHSEKLGKNLTKMLDKIPSESNLEVSSDNSGGGKTEKFESLIGSRVTVDNSILNEMKLLEKELRQTNHQPNIKKFGIRMNSGQKKLLEKYQSSIALSSTTGVKLAIQVMIKLLKELAVEMEQHNAKLRLEAEILQEKEQFKKEKNKAMNDMLKVSIKKFTQQCQFENAVVEYVLDQEAGDSDDDFNIFDQMAAGVNKEQAESKLKEEFKNKIKLVKKEIEKDDAPTIKIDKFVSKDNMNEVIEQTKYVPKPKVVKQSRIEQPKDDQSSMRATMNIGSKYYEESQNDNLPVDFEMTRTQKTMAFVIQQEVAMLKKKLELLSPEHQNAFNQFFQICEQRNIMPLPLLSKVQMIEVHKTLSLENYWVNSGQIQSLSEVMHLFGTISKVSLINNGIQDEDMAVLLSKICLNRNIKKLEISNNKLQEKGINALSEFLKIHGRLDSLELSCNRSLIGHTNILCESLSNYFQLKELKLNDFKLSQQASKCIATVIQTNIDLHILDLGWSQIYTKDLLFITAAIRSNKTLKDVSLKHIGCQRQFSSQVCAHLHHFIRKNRCLQHLDLSYMYLSGEEVYQVVQAVNKSRTLLCIHLTGNLFESHAMRTQIRDLLKPRKRLPINGQETTEEQDRKQTEEDEECKTPLSQRSRDQMPANDGKGETLVFSRVLGHYEMPHSYRWSECRDCWFCEHHSYTLILASKSIASHYFLKPTQQEKDAYQAKIQNSTKKHEDLVKMHQTYSKNYPGSDHDDVFYDAIDDTDFTPAHSKKLRPQYYRNNMIAGRFTDWKMRSMIPLKNFIRLLLKNKQPQLRYIELDKNKYQAQLQEIKDSRDDRYKHRLDKSIKKQLQNHGQIKFSQLKATKWSENIYNSDLPVYHQGWLDKLIKLLPYRHNTNFIVDPALIDNLKIQTQGDQLNEKVYLLACFLPPGRHDSVLLFNSNEDTSQKVKSMISAPIKVRARNYPIAVKTKKVQQFRVERQFIRDQSLFREWEEPDIFALITMDVEQSKLSTVAKDFPNLESVNQVLQDYGNEMMELFQYLMSQSSYPTISIPEFIAYCVDYKLINGDEEVKLAEQAFKASAAGTRPAPGKLSGALCRNEFLEAIVRIAKFKYLDSGQFVSLGLALKKLITDQVLENPVPSLGGMSFRQSSVWILGIDDIFRSNLGAMTDLYIHLMGPPDPQTARPKKDLGLKQLQAVSTELDMTEKQIAEAYSFSKVYFEDEFQNYEEYKKLKIFEFYECVVRMAAIRFKSESHLPITDKTERMLDLLFKLTGAKRQAAVNELDVSSESDYETDD